MLVLSVLLIATLPAGAQQVEPAAIAQPTAISLFGMNTYFTGRERISHDGDAGVASLITKGRQIGVAWAREELSWGNLERDGKGRWQWDAVDRPLTKAAQAGYGIVGMLLTTPAWARVSDCSQRSQRYAAAGVRAENYWCPPASSQDFADYVRAVVERYDGDGKHDAPGSPRVAAWQIWNEPNAWETWPGTPAEFATIWQAGYAAAKAADPTALVVSPGLYVFDGQWYDSVGHSDGLRYLDQVLMGRPGLWSSFDVLAIHPYMPDVAPDQPGLYGTISFWGRLNTARAWLDAHTQRYGGQPRPLWISEIGWSTCTANQSDCYAGAAASSHRASVTLDALVGKSEQQQADYLVRTYALAMATGVQHLSWFQLEDKFDGSLHNFWEEAAIFATAAEGYRAKPAAQAYATLTGLLSGARFLGLGSLNTFIYSPTANSPQARFHLRFLSADNRIVDVLWRNAGAETVDLSLEAGRTAELRDRSGSLQPFTTINGVTSVGIGESPIFLVQSLPPALSVSLTRLSTMLRPSDPAQQVRIHVANSGSGSISWSATSSAGWVTVQTPTGQGYSSILYISINPGGLQLGSYSTTLRVSSVAGTWDIPLHLVVRAQVERRYMPFVGR